MPQRQMLASILEYIERTWTHMEQINEIKDERILTKTTLNLVSILISERMCFLNLSLCFRMFSVLHVSAKKLGTPLTCPKGQLPTILVVDSLDLRNMPNVGTSKCLERPHF